MRTFYVYIILEGEGEEKGGGGGGRQDLQASAQGQIEKAALCNKGADQCQ